MPIVPEGASPTDSPRPRAPHAPARPGRAPLPIDERLESIARQGLTTLAELDALRKDVDALGELRENVQHASDLLTATNRLLDAGHAQHDAERAELTAAVARLREAHEALRSSVDGRIRALGESLARGRESRRQQAEALATLRKEHDALASAYDRSAAEQRKLRAEFEPVARSFAALRGASH